MGCLVGIQALDGNSSSSPSSPRSSRFFCKCHNHMGSHSFLRLTIFCSAKSRLRLRSRTLDCNSSSPALRDFLAGGLVSRSTGTGHFLSSFLGVSCLLMRVPHFPDPWLHHFPDPWLFHNPVRCHVVPAEEIAVELCHAHSIRQGHFLPNFQPNFLRRNEARQDQKPGVEGGGQALFACVPHHAPGGCCPKECGDDLRMQHS